MGRSSRTIWATLIGIVSGAIIGAIVAINLIIYAGIGYDVAFAEVFRQNWIVGSLAAAIQAAGPIVGAVLARRKVSGNPSFHRS